MLLFAAQGREHMQRVRSQTSRPLGHLRKHLPFLNVSLFISSVSAQIPPHMEGHDVLWVGAAFFSASPSLLRATGRTDGCSTRSSCQADKEDTMIGAARSLTQAVSQHPSSMAHVICTTAMRMRDSKKRDSEIQRPSGSYDDNLVYGTLFATHPLYSLHTVLAPETHFVVALRVSHSVSTPMECGVAVCSSGMKHKCSALDETVQ